MPKHQRVVELHPAHRFDCDECGRENFLRAMIPEFSDEDIEELFVEYGIDPDEGGVLISTPDSVTCQFCGAEFQIEIDEAYED